MKFSNVHLAHFFFFLSFSFLREKALCLPGFFFFFFFSFKLLQKRARLMKCRKTISEDHCREERKQNCCPGPRGRETAQQLGTDLRTNLEVSLLMIPVDVPLRAWAKAPGSCEGEAGGPL